MSRRVKANYRKIWEEYTSLKIPKGFHIHHIDGNRENNNPENLMCISPEEHFNLHLVQGDIVAKYGKFIQGASAAGKIGGSKSRPNWNEEKLLNLSIALKKSFAIRGGSPLKGCSISEQTKKKISTANAGELNPMFGEHHSEKTKKKLSEIGKTKTGEKNNFYGRKHSEETKKLMSELDKPRNAGALNPMHGRSAVKEQNLKWYTNGINAIYVSEGSQPDGYQRGRKLKV